MTQQSKDPMGIGIVVYSLGCRTLLVAMTLKEKLSAAGHQVALEWVETVAAAKPSTENSELKTKPAIGPYDTLVFATPVRGGTPPPPMRKYLEQLPSLHSKKVACLVTHFFHREWGADQTIRQMKEICKAKDATVRGSGSVRWFSLQRKRQISQVIDELSELFISNLSIGEKREISLRERLGLRIHPKRKTAGTLTVRAVLSG